MKTTEISGNFLGNLGRPQTREPLTINGQSLFGLGRPQTREPLTINGQYVVAGLGGFGVLNGLSGLGELAQAAMKQGSPTPAMDAIIAQQKQMVKGMRQYKVKVLSADAVMLDINSRETDSTAELRRATAAMTSAAASAVKAKNARNQAAAAIKRGDKRGAAALAIKYMTEADKASIQAGQNEKLRLQKLMEAKAGTLTKSASALERAAEAQKRVTGMSPATNRISATVQQARQEAEKLSAAAQGAASLPVMQQYDEKRLADVANKFNQRTSMMGNTATAQRALGVLADSMHEPGAQTQDYSRAASYYGNDVPGRLMANIEFSNKRGALAGLALAEPMANMYGLGSNVGCCQGDGFIASRSSGLGGLGSTSAAGTDCPVPAGTSVFGITINSEADYDNWCNCMFTAADANKACKAINILGIRTAPWGAMGDLAKFLGGAGGIIKAGEDLIGKTQQPATGAPPPPPGVSKSHNKYLNIVSQQTDAELAAQAAAARAAASSTITIPFLGAVKKSTLAVGGLALAGGIGYMVFRR